MDTLNKLKHLNRRKLIKIIGYSTLSGFSFKNLAFSSSNLHKLKWEGSILNSPAKLILFTENKRLGEKVIDKVSNLAEKYDNIFNLQNDRSEIHLLNKNKSFADASDELIDVIMKSKIISKETLGSFDITVQPLWEMYYNHFILRSQTEPPSKETIKNTLRKVNWKNVTVLEKDIFLNANTSITLNGIAQGYITDKITNVLLKNGFKNNLVDFGETKVSGKFNNIRPWKIGLQGPDGVQDVINVMNKAVATSGGYGTIFEPTITYHHIFNTNTGYSSNQYKAVSVISNEAWLSDAISTAALSIKKNELVKICKKFNLDIYILNDVNFEKIS